MPGRAEHSIRRTAGVRSDALGVLKVQLAGIAQNGIDLRMMRQIKEPMQTGRVAERFPLAQGDGERVDAARLRS